MGNSGFQQPDPRWIARFTGNSAEFYGGGMYGHVQRAQSLVGLRLFWQTQRPDTAAGCIMQGGSSPEPPSLRIREERRGLLRRRDVDVTRAARRWSTCIVLRAIVAAGLAAG